MVVQRKRKTIKKVTNSNVFVWTGPRKKAALFISEGTKNYEEIAGEVGVHRKTFWEWRQHPIFQAEVSRLTLANEKATKEGLLRLAYKAIEEKMGNIADDRSTVLEWSKFIADLQGHVKKQVGLDANMKHEVKDLSKMTDEELVEIINNE
jgi:transposase-like protein